MDAKAYIERIVVPTLNDYTENVTSLRHGFLACVATYHALDYMAPPNKRKNLRATWGNECPSFAIIDRIAHAFKHVEAGVPARPEKHLAVSSVISRPPANWDAAVWDLSRWDDEHGGITLATDTKLDLLDELRLALAFLQQKLPPK